MSARTIIEKTKKLIDLPYNKFNLQNYMEQVEDTYTGIIFHGTDLESPISLMSGRSMWSGLVCKGVVSPGKSVYIIGKGILFDAGGLNIKGDDMYEMTGDKAGMLVALAVTEILKGKNVLACCPVTTNFPQTSKITPGDKYKIGKKTVEVVNTDAEGRLIIAEALTTLPIRKEDIVITVATLTGAVEYAIDKVATGVFTPNPKLAKAYACASWKTGELSWLLPLWDYLEKKYYSGKTIKNDTEDIKAGATEGALFIKQFVPYPENWIHLDIASSAFAKGKANGAPIETIVEFIRSLK